MANSEGFAKAYVKIRDHMLNDEPNFVEGERVECIRQVDFIIGPLQVGDRGTVEIEWVGERFGVVCNCFVISVRLDRGSLIRSGNMESLWKSVDPRFTNAPKKGWQLGG